ncbi:putative uncharacterized protein DDB_G0285119, partial [Melanaphis sacchari]|uniref:putative uncharacterized protein DDB_G0285119 n=1 Tax=Melanaphis sacchari TaxID=742174 RepID=UPI000DC15852
IQITEDLVEQNEDQNTDPLKSEEEYKMKNSLKILQSLVNIEHDKLEVQKSLTTNEIQLNNEKNEINVYKSSKNTIIKKKKSRKSQENIHKEEEEWLPSNARQKNHSSKNRTKINKGKNHKNKAPKKNRKLKTQKTLNNSSTSNSNCSVKIQNGQSTLLTMKESLVSSCTKKNETVVSTIKNTKSLDTICSTETQMTYLNVKYCPPTNELLELDDFENIPHSEKKKCLRKVKNSDMLPNKTCPIASTSGNNKKDVDNLKNKSSSSSSSTMKISDYKKLYEKDRKSLFSPDIIIKNISSKPSKDLTNVLHIKKEYNSIQKKEEPEKKSKPAVCKVENNNKTSNKRKKSTKNNTDEVKITENCSKLTHDSKSKSNHASSTKYKRIKLVKNDKRAKTNTVSNTNNKSNTIDISVNKASGNNNTLGSEKLNRTMKMENNMSGESTSKHQQLNEVNVLENKESDKNTLESETVPEWLRRLYVIHNIKPLYVIINPNITY